MSLKNYAENRRMKIIIISVLIDVKKKRSRKISYL